jgi:hypothetical protein
MLRTVMLIAATLLAATRVVAGQSLSPADIEKATGLQGVHQVPGTAPGAVPGRDNYADASGKIVLWFQTMNRTGFLRAKGQAAKMMNGMVVQPALYHGAVAGLGDDAFDSPDGKVQSAIYVRKGETAFGVISNIDAAGKPRITMDQLKAIAAAVVSRM